MSLDVDAKVVQGSFLLDTAFRAQPNEIVAVLGPNGAGKSTLLRTLAGLRPVDAGRVVLNGQVLDDPAAAVFVVPERRPVGVVFQDFLLFPHLSAVDNVAFGLRRRGQGRTAARAQARRWLDRVGLTAVADRRPRELSGGQAQRVALVRALATEPALLLLDEPLSSLDVRTRADVRRDLRRVLASFPGIRVIVTHDPTEALTLADRLIVIEDGRVVQTGTPEQVTAQPRSSYVARFVGVNLMPGWAHDDQIAVNGGADLVVPHAGRGPVYAMIHPRAVSLHRDAPAGSPRNVWKVTVHDLDPEPDVVRVALAGKPEIVAEITLAAAEQLDLRPGLELWASVKATEIQVYPA